jgi:hypothetical protein
VTRLEKHTMYIKYTCDRVRKTYNIRKNTPVTRLEKHTIYVKYTCDKVKKTYNIRKIHLWQG